MATIKTFEGLAGKVEVRGVHGGVVCFDDDTRYLVLAVDGLDELKMMFPFSLKEDGEAVVFAKHWKETMDGNGEGMSEFEKDVMRAAVELSFTKEEKQNYSLSKEKRRGFFSDLF